MTDCQSGLINPTILRNLTDYKPTVYNNTQWSGKYLMIKKFNQLRSILIQTADSEHSQVVIDGGSIFKMKCENWE